MHALVILFLMGWGFQLKPWPRSTSNLHISLLPLPFCLFFVLTSYQTYYIWWSRITQNIMIWKIYSEFKIDTSNMWTKHKKFDLFLLSSKLTTCWLLLWNPMVEESQLSVSVTTNGGKRYLHGNFFFFFCWVDICMVLHQTKLDLNISLLFIQHAMRNRAHPFAYQYELYYISFVDQMVQIPKTIVWWNLRTRRALKPEP